MVNSLTAPASLGSMGVLKNHAPLFTTLETGLLSYKKTGQELEAYCLALDNGIMEVYNNHVLVLVQAAEKAQDIDLSRAQAALTRAKERLAEHSKDLDVLRAEASIKRAQNRIRACQWP